MLSNRVRNPGISRVWILAVCLALTGAFPIVTLAEGEGQADLDEAIVKKLDAESLQQIQEVAGLLRSALAKGLDEENEAFAKEMLGAISMQEGQALAERLLTGQVPPQAARRVLNQALKSLETAVENAPNLAEAHMLIARLSTITGGNLDRAREAASKAIEILAGDPKQQSEAYVLRSLLQPSDVERKQDLDKAVELDPENKQAWQARALLLVKLGKNEEALEELQKLLEEDPENLQLTLVAVETMLQLERYDDAIDVIDRAIAADPQAALYLVRSQINQQQDKEQEALEDLNKALELEPNNLRALLERATLALEDDLQAAKEDINKVLLAEPNSIQAIMLRSIIAAEEGRLQDAINDIKLLARADPNNPTWVLQLANLYQLDNRPRKAIEVVSELLERDPNNIEALRTRADAKLSIGDHKTAVEDFERALEIGIEDPAKRSGLLNNLAWVYATSPEEELRNAERALELAIEANRNLELAKEQAENPEQIKTAHILSTVAAAYAENGNFEEAIKWSQRAVDAGREEQIDQLEQLENELESYRNGEPWREKQEVEENKTPLLRPEDIIDT